MTGRARAWSLAAFLGLAGCAHTIPRNAVSDFFAKDYDLHSDTAPVTTSTAERSERSRSTFCEVDIEVRDGGASVASASVVLSWPFGELARLTTDASGHASIRMGPDRPNRIDIVAACDDGDAAMETADLFFDSAQVTIDMSGPRTILRVRGRVLDYRGAPAVGASVRCTGSWQSGRQFTDARGSFEIWGRRGDVLELTVMLPTPEAEPIELEVTVPAKDLTIRFPE